MQEMEAQGRVYLHISSGIIEKASEFQKNVYFCFIDYAKAFDYVDHNTLWEILQEIGIPDHLTCLLRNLCCCCCCCVASVVLDSV